MSSLKSKEHEDILIVGFKDAKILDDSRIQQIGDELLEMTTRATGARLLLNFEGVSFMSSAMIGKLVLLNRKCRADDIALKLCSIAPTVAEVFSIMRLNRVFDIHKDEEKAIGAFSKKGWFS